MMCANGILMALLDRVRTGHGQVVDADMVANSYLDFVVLSLPV